MELRNKICKRLVIKGIKKVKINKHILNKVQIQSNSYSVMNQDQVVKELIDYSHDFSRNAISTCKRYDWNKKHSYKLAIILPVYNGEKYIIKCLESLLHQVSEYKYQIILINDGSTDGTARVIKQYLSDSRVLYIEQKNRGHSGARNKGLELVNAEYITFVDADDFVPLDMVQTLVKAAVINNADIVQGGFEKFLLKDIIRKKIIYNKGIVMNNYTVSGFPWAKIFRASLFEKIQFPEGYWYEDSIMSHLVFPLAKKIVTISNIVYFYRVNMHGISRTSFKYKKCIDSSWILEQMLISRKELGLDNDKKYLGLFLSQIVINYNREFNVNEDIKKLIFSYSSNLYHQYFKACDNFSELNSSKQKLALALKNKDYSAYKKICTYY